MTPPASITMPSRPAAAAPAHRFGADRGQVNAAVLSGLRRLVEDPPRGKSRIAARPGHAGRAAHDVCGDPERIVEKTTGHGRDRVAGKKRGKHPVGARLRLDRDDLPFRDH
jgi:hypothetical protein